MLTCDLLWPVTCGQLLTYCDLWPDLVTCDLWLVTYCDLWPVTGDRWPVTCDLWPAPAVLHVLLAKDKKWIEKRHKSNFGLILRAFWRHFVDVVCSRPRCTGLAAQSWVSTGSFIITSTSTLCSWELNNDITPTWSSFTATLSPFDTTYTLASVVSSRRCYGRGVSSWE